LRRYPRSSPGAWAVGCTHLHFPPKATEPVLQSSARRCMHVHGMLWSCPREINQVLLGSVREFDELVAEDHPFRQLATPTVVTQALLTHPRYRAERAHSFPADLHRKYRAANHGRLESEAAIACARTS
jgi:hypothetical protein